MTWARVYSAEQKLAIERAALDDGITPMTAIVRRAEAGELRLEGKVLEPFQVPPATVRDIVRTARRRRSGTLDSALAQASVPTAIDTVRRRLLSFVDHELKAMELSTRSLRGKPDMKRVSAAAKVAREAFALTTGSVRDDPGPAQRNAQRASNRPVPIASRGILTTLDPAHGSHLQRDPSEEGSATGLGASASNEENENEANGEADENGGSAGTYIRDRMGSLSADHVELGPPPRARVH